ncbi:MAG: hypothetical protein KC649_07410 [Candidatus Omnitrophica bacterium]|nr:hypothetical protein [Candidatus Omnitrophota bacterium]
MRFPSLKFQIRAVSAIIVLLFAAEQIVWAVPNHPAGGYDFSSAKIFTSPEIFTAGTGIRSDTARIEETYKGAGDVRIHLIQDAHTNASAQFNISVIINRLLTERKLQTVYLEAGDGDVSLSALKSGTEKSRRISVGEKYVRKGFMQGAEFANLTSDLDFSLWGVEDQRLYEDALNEYRRISEGREKALQYLASADSLMNAVRHEVLSKPALELYESRKRFLNHESGIQEYVADLERLAADSKTDAEAFPLLTDFIRIKKTEDEINFEKAQQERDLAVDSLEISAAESISRSFR